MSSPAAPTPPEPPWREFARAPLVPVALAATAGLVAERYVGVPLSAALGACAVAFVGWYFARATPGVALGWLLVCCASLAAGYHHWHRYGFDADDISELATNEPVAVTLRGVLADEPERYRPPRFDPLLTVQRPATSNCVLQVRELRAATGPERASGRVRLVVEGRLDDLHCGDEVEVTGRLWKPDGPRNPGERDRAELLRDQRIGAELRVKRGADSVVRLEEGWRASLFGWLAALRGWGARTLARELPDESGLATALLLGDGTALEREEWDQFVRTGVLHVLAISGQHLVILGWFVWLFVRVCGLRRRYAAWAVAGLLVGYALLTGARPSAVRAAVMVTATCGALVLRRPVFPANALALGWLVVVTANPTDPFTVGCQLSFVSVFVLVWGAARWLAPRDLTPIEQLIEECRGPVERAARWLFGAVWRAFAVSALLSAANAPLVLAWQNVASPVGVLLGPPLVLLTAVALIAGFLLLLTAPVAWFVAWPLARLTEWSLSACEWLVRLGDRVPGGQVYAPAPAQWWLVGFYALLATGVLCGAPWAKRAFAALGVWLVFGLAVGSQARASDELRVTVLAVGHGTCAVLETPDGRVLLYDAGTVAGPDAVRHTIAPFLWHRGIARIDEVFLSHADLDHFNGVPELLRRFHVGRVTFTPTFAQKDAPGVEAVLAVLERRGVETRVAVAGDSFAAGAVALEVLHPPAVGPPGPENVRSLVLLVRHAGHRVLLTGDLEGEGQAFALAHPLAPVDVLLVPHHGSKGANAPRGTPEKPERGDVARWARPKLVVSSQRAGAPVAHLRASYGAQVWDTPSFGAVTLRSHTTGLVAEAFRAPGAVVVTRGPRPRRRVWRRFRPLAQFARLNKCPARVNLALPRDRIAVNSFVFFPDGRGHH
jgi:competence protein ComEC